MIELICKIKMKKKIILLLLFIVCFNIHLYSQKDTLKSILSDIDIQIESTNAINKMYNFNFDEAEKEFTWLIDEYKNHPLPIFLLGLSKWWRIEAEVNQGIESEGEAKQKNNLDNQFLSLMDKSISLSKKVYEDGNKIDGAFFLAASYGFKGRLLSERKKWRKAAFSGKNALKYLKEIRKEDYLIPEIAFGNGLFNYYSIWISDKYPILKPIISFFPKGNKIRGIEQLDNAAKNSFYTRTEAQYFLMRIFSEENKLSKALQISNYLHNIYPMNSIFHKYYTQLLYRSGYFDECEIQLNELLKNYLNNILGYNVNIVRNAHFFKAEIERKKLNIKSAKENYLKSIEYSIQMNNQRLGYTLYSYYYLGKIEYDNRNFKTSKQYFKRVIRLSKRKEKINIDSRNYLSKIK